MCDADKTRRPIVYACDQELRALPTGVVRTGVAWSFDGHTVFHAHLGERPGRPAGSPLACAALRLAGGRDVDVDDQLEDAIATFRARGVSGPAVALVVIAGAGPLVLRAVFLREGRAIACEAVCMLPESELYSRSRGLIETSVLRRACVGVVGVGSGGAPVAVELAKAGVGHFVLIDPDRLELANVVRHVCGVSDLGRFKTRAVRDAILDKNPYARVETHEIDVNEDLDATAAALVGVDLLVAATDGNRSRFNLNQLALDLEVTALFGRALTRAAGGEVLRVRPFGGPCLACLSTQGLFGSGEEVSSGRQARQNAPAYMSPGDIDATIQPGLSADIAPISNMIVRLALVELSRGTSAAVTSLEEDLRADFYIWANRRELSYEGYEPMGYGSTVPTVLRWYGARIARRPGCPVCDDDLWGDPPADSYADPAWLEP